MAQLTGGITLFSSYIMFSLSRFPFNTLFKVNAKPFDDFVVSVVVVAVEAAVVVVAAVVGTHEH